MKVGIVGKGFVGSAVAASYAEYRFYDPYKAGSVDNLSDLIDCEVIYICVPTPQAANGACDAGAVIETLDILDALDFKGLIIAKSTAPYSVYEKYAERLMLAFIPELLRANTAVQDYLSSEFMTVGCKDAQTFERVLNAINESALINCKSFRQISIREACLMKYFENSFFAVKVSMMNEFRDLVLSVGANWDNVIDCLTLDPRICPDHTQVPGPDGKFGWGGHCLPKDTSALLKIAADNSIELTTLKAAVLSNNYYRNIE